MISCPYCSSIHNRKKGFSERTGLQRYECRGCGRNYTTATVPKSKRGEKSKHREKPLIILCPECGKETTNPKFCSSSCAAARNNRLYPKRAKSTVTCKRCGREFIRKGRERRICSNCKRERYVDWSQRNLSDIQKAAKYQVSAALRNIARQIFRNSGRPRICQNCGYSKHVEICHIRAIHDFPDNTPVSIVSGIDNLVALCPNCHWEFDHGRLKYEDIAPLQD
jgi:hypothetical protein